MTGWRERVAKARTELAAAGVPSPDVDAVVLAAHTARVEVAEMRRLMVLDRAVEPGQGERYAALVTERASRVPLQHLTGRAGFRRLDLAVGPGVFVPRPETELTAGLAIDAARAAMATGTTVHPVVVDLCTGSGAIALSVKDEVPEATVHAVELAESAYHWANRNREFTGLDLDLVLGDAATALPELDGRVDVVVSNPPYIPDGSHPQDPEVRDHDPGEALYGGGHDGLDVPRRVAVRAAALLGAGGVLVMEHADTQGDSLPAMLGATGRWTDITDHIDLVGRPRVTVAIRR